MNAMNQSKSLLVFSNLQRFKFYNSKKLIFIQRIYFIQTFSVYKNISFSVYLCKGNESGATFWLELNKGGREQSNIREAR